MLNFKKAPKLKPLLNFIFGNVDLCLMTNIYILTPKDREIKKDCMGGEEPYLLAPGVP